MKRIIIHWTVGQYKPNAHELDCYHYLISYDANNKEKPVDVHQGVHKPEDNINCNDGKYAAHTGGGNTGSIGVALCGMLGYEHNEKTNIRKLGSCPLKQEQFERCFKLCAELCKKYALTISPITVMTHYEFGKRNPQTSSRYKIDINFIPYLPNIRPEEVGNYIRNKVQWYFDRL